MQGIDAVRQSLHFCGTQIILTGNPCYLFGTLSNRAAIYRNIRKIKIGIGCIRNDLEMCILDFVLTGDIGLGNQDCIFGTLRSFCVADLNHIAYCVIEIVAVFCGRVQSGCGTGGLYDHAAGNLKRHFTFNDCVFDSVIHNRFTVIGTFSERIDTVAQTIDYQCFIR